MTIKTTLNAALNRSGLDDAQKLRLSTYFTDLVAERTYAGHWCGHLCVAALSDGATFLVNDVELSFDPEILDDTNRRSVSTSLRASLARLISHSRSALRSSARSRFVRTCYRAFVDTTGPHPRNQPINDALYQHIHKVYEDLTVRGALPNFRMEYVPPSVLPGRAQVHASAADLCDEGLQRHLVENYCGRLHILLQTRAYGLERPAHRCAVIGAILCVHYDWVVAECEGEFVWGEHDALVQLVRAERDRFRVPADGQSWATSRDEWRPLNDGEELTKTSLKVRYSVFLGIPNGGRSEFPEPEKENRPTRSLTLSLGRTTSRPSSCPRGTPSGPSMRTTPPSPWVSATSCSQRGHWLRCRRSSVFTWSSTTTP